MAVLDNMPVPEITPDYLAEYNGTQLLITSGLFIPILTLFVFLRLYWQIARVSRIYYDDVLIVVAYVSMMGLCGISIAMIKASGGGYHVLALQDKPEVLETWTRLLLAFVVLTYVGILFARLALLSLYLRLFNWRRWGFKYTWTVVLMVLMSCVLVVGIVLTSTICRIAGYEGPYSICGGHCERVRPYWRFKSYAGIVADFLIMILPWRTIWKLKLPMSEKMTVVVFFALASFGVVSVTVTRVTIAYFKTFYVDTTYSSITLCSIYMVEVSLYIVFNCLSQLRPLIIKVAPKWVIGCWRNSMTWLGGLLRMPHLSFPRVGRPPPESPRGPSNGKLMAQVEHHTNGADGAASHSVESWEGPSTAELGKVDTNLGGTKVTWVKDPYMLGHNSKTVGVSSWTAVGPVTEEMAMVTDALKTNNSIQITLEVSMKTVSRTRTWEYGQRNGLLPSSMSSTRTDRRVDGPSTEQLDKMRK